MCCSQAKSEGSLPLGFPYPLKRRSAKGNKDARPLESPTAMGLAYLSIQNQHPPSEDVAVS